MPILKKSAWTVIKEWALVTLGILIYVTGWSLFLIPNNLVAAAFPVSAPSSNMLPPARSRWVIPTSC